YENDYHSIRNMNIIFLEEEMTLSHSRTNVINKFLKSKREQDLNFVISDDEFKTKDFEVYKHVIPEDFNDVSNELIYRYSTGEYKKINVYSSVNDGRCETIVPIKELKGSDDYKYSDVLNSRTSFHPNVELVLEKAFLDYILNIITHYYSKGKYIDFKKTLLKHESSIEHVNGMVIKIKSSLNKIRQSKLTEEILLSYRGETDD
ncbi:MAG: hypothetical protein KAG14_01385, partial [Mycoplasmataceae bacterium]|nr:hypothetical protein [Mycoplasmataceae bacterium]